MLCDIRVWLLTFRFEWFWLVVWAVLRLVWAKPPQLQVLCVHEEKTSHLHFHTVASACTHLALIVCYQMTATLPCLLVPSKRFTKNALLSERLQHMMQPLLECGTVLCMHNHAGCFTDLAPLP